MVANLSVLPVALSANSFDVYKQPTAVVPHPMTVQLTEYLEQITNWSYT
jgi:hypothetical protein